MPSDLRYFSSVCCQLSQPLLLMQDCQRHDAILQIPTHSLIQVIVDLGAVIRYATVLEVVGLDLLRAPAGPNLGSPKCRCSCDEAWPGLTALMAGPRRPKALLMRSSMPRSHILNGGPMAMEATKPWEHAAFATA